MEQWKENKGEKNATEDIQWISRLVDISDISVYVAAFETDELLYINQAGRKVLGVGDSIPCQSKCYEFLMHRDSPCPFCHKTMMQEEEFRENVITFPFNGRQYRISSKIIDWKGRKAHVHFITDETDLMNEQKQLRTLTDHIPAGIGIYYVYLDGRIEPVYLNDGYYKMIHSERKNREQYNGFTVLEAIHPRDRKILEQKVKNAIQNKEQVNHEIRVKRDDGTYIWLGIRADIVKRSEDRFTLYCAYSDIDQLKRMQQALEESSKKLAKAYEKLKADDRSFQTMLEHIPGAMIVFRVSDHMLQLKYISESCRSISGYTAEETYMRHRMDPLADAHPDSKNFFLEHEWEDIQRGGEISYTYQIRCKDGTYKWVNLTLSPVKEKEVLYYGVFRDIDAIETEHVEQESKFTQLIAGMEDMDTEDLLEKGRYDLTDDQTLYFNKRIQGHLEMGESGTYDKALERIREMAVRQEDAEELGRLLNRAELIEAYQGGRRNGFYEYQRREDETGTPYWSLIRYSMYESPDRGHIILFAYTYDITDRVLENKMIAKLGETEYDVLGLIDVKTHHFESKSQRGVKSLAGAENRFIKGKFEEVVHQQIYATVLETEREELEKQLTMDVVLKALSVNDFYVVPFSAYRSDKSYRRKKMNFCYLDNSHTILFYFCNDITERYDREQEQLRKTEDALEAARIASESKTEFFSRMSHDMRTPMNGILGMADLSEDENDVTVLKENMHKIKNSGEYLLGLINDTLDFQRIESGRMQLEPEIVNCQDVVHNILDMVQQAAVNKGLNLKMMDYNTKLDWYIRVDPVRLKQIFVNLLSNAIKFTPSGGTISVECERIRREGMMVYNRYYIRDTGIGMSEDFLKYKIFRPFSQEHNTVTGQYAGSGLGLSIVKKLVELMGGTIHVRSEPGAGTEFVLELAIERVDDADVMKKEASEMKHQKNIAQFLQGRKILLSEDHPLNAEIAQKLLEKVGCSVDWAQNGQECIDLFCSSKTGQYDVILMDVRMPVMDGLEATRRIRRSGREDGTTIPIIAMTANAYETDIENCIKAGMSGHLAKPIEPAKLYEVLANYMI